MQENAQVHNAFEKPASEVLIAKLSAGKAALTLSQVEAPSGAGKPEGLLARGFAA